MQLGGCLFSSASFRELFNMNTICGRLGRGRVSHMTTKKSLVVAVCIIGQFHFENEVIAGLDRNVH